jgi:hypothetical protein
MRKDRQVNNKICGAIRCSAAATRIIILSVGFSAYFCERCANELVNIGIGVEGRNAAVHADVNVTQ